MDNKATWFEDLPSEDRKRVWIERSRYLPANGLPPWGSEMSPRAVIAWLTHDPITNSNLGGEMADQILQKLKDHGYEVRSCG